MRLSAVGESASAVIADTTAERMTIIGSAAVIIANVYWLVEVLVLA